MVGDDVLATRQGSFVNAARIGTSRRHWEIASDVDICPYILTSVVLPTLQKKLISLF